jgi:hypothetical protein
MSVQHADPWEVVVHFHEEHASVAKRRVLPGLLRRRFGFGVSNTNHRERVMFHCQEAIGTRGPFEPPVADGRPKEWLTQTKPK